MNQPWLVTSLSTTRGVDILGWTCTSDDPAAIVDVSVLCCQHDATTRPKCNYERDRDGDGRAHCVADKQQAVSGGCVTDGDTPAITASMPLANYGGWDCSANNLNAGTDGASAVVVCCDAFLTVPPRTSLRNVNRQTTYIRSALLPSLFMRCTPQSAYGHEVSCPFHKKAVSGSCYDANRQPLTASTWTAGLNGWSCAGAGDMSRMVVSALCCDRIVW